MSGFQHIRLVSVEGAEAPADPSDPDSPYHPHEHASRIAREVANSFVREIRWSSNGRPCGFRFTGNGSIHVAFHPESDLLLSTSGGDPRFAAPANIVALNADGTVNHQVFPPPAVRQALGGGPVRDYPVESMSDLYVDDSRRLVIGLDFHHEWIERRCYDPCSRQWGARVLVYRR